MPPRLSGASNLLIVLDMAFAVPDLDANVVVGREIVAAVMGGRYEDVSAVR
jgi:hypothetical protein